MFLRPFGLYLNACFGILFESILCTCCSHFFWYCFISFTIFCAPVFSLMHWFFSLSNFVIPSKCLKNFLCAASKRCSSLFLSTQASLPNFNAASAVMLWILNFVSLFICFPKFLPFILLYVCSKTIKQDKKFHSESARCVILYWIQIKYYNQTKHLKVCKVMYDEGSQWMTNIKALCLTAVLHFCSKQHKQLTRKDRQIPITIKFGVISVLLKIYRYFGI